MSHTEEREGFCFICGNNSKFYSYESMGTPCKRNSFICEHCNSIARNRHIAKIILEKFQTNPKSNSLKDFSSNAKIKILHTCAREAIHNYLKNHMNYTVCEYYDNVPSGAIINNILCQNLENTTFPDNSFDLIITEEIFEHIADPKKAFKEIKRILKPNGLHIATIAVYWDKQESITRTKTENDRLIHILPPFYHGDPNRKEGALVFTDFGADIIERYCSLTGKTKILWSNNNKFDEENYAIFNNMVFVSRKDTKILAFFKKFLAYIANLFKMKIGHHRALNNH